MRTCYAKPHRSADADREAIPATLGRETAASVAARHGVSKGLVDSIRRQRRVDHGILVIGVAALGAEDPRAPPARRPAAEAPVHALPIPEQP